MQADVILSRRFRRCQAHRHYLASAVFEQTRQRQLAAFLPDRFSAPLPYDANGGLFLRQRRDRLCSRRRQDHADAIGFVGLKRRGQAIRHIPARLC